MINRDRLVAHSWSSWRSIRLRAMRTRSRRSSSGGCSAGRGGVAGCPWQRARQARWRGRCRSAFRAHGHGRAGRGIKPVFDGDDIIRSDGTTILGADNKAGCAVILEVFAVGESRTARRDRTIEVAISRGEEIGLVGAAHMDYSRISATVAIVIDSGGPPSSIQGSAPYSYGYTVEVHGQSAHAGLEPEKGIPAITSPPKLCSGCRKAASTSRPRERGPHPRRARPQRRPRLLPH